MQDRGQNLSNIPENAEFWMTHDFWIFLVLSLASLFFSILAYYAAKAAKVAARAAAETVKIQTITIELNENCLIS